MKAPNISLTGGGIAGLAVVAAVAGLGLYAYANRKAIGQALDKVNPASSGNVVYSGVSSVVTAASGEDNSLGTWLYNLKARWFPSEADQAVADLVRPVSVPPVDGSILDRWDYYARGPIASESRYLDPAAAASNGDVFGYPSP